MTDDDIYTEDDNLDAVLMTAPDEAYCRVCGGSIVTDGASDWQHVDACITDHQAPALRYPYHGHPRGAVVLALADRPSGSHRTDLNQPPPTSISGGDVKRAISQPGKGPTHGKRIDDRRGLPSRA